ncbi:MAG: ThuA domain-containing protein [Halieaceae bacterium]|nr:ThuA domain-containing protein [Halieaceae bacterium]
MPRFSLPGLFLYLALLTHPLLAIAGDPLNALILTTPGVYHDYQKQTQMLAHSIAERANVRFDVSLAELERWKDTDYSAGYDVLIYNLCLADNQDAKLIANMRRQTEQLGVPALLIHCTMHSFRTTDLWWPMSGLKTVAHEPLGTLTLTKAVAHPVLTDIPDNWVLSQDELYSNLSFKGEALLTATGLDGQPQVTAWLARPGGTPVFGTTLGHSDETMKSPHFQRLLASALLHVTSNLSPEGKPTPGMAGDPAGVDIFETLSAPEGVKFLGEEGLACTYRELVIAAGPCYLRCILNPLEWGAETAACKTACESELPSSNALIQRCTP